MHFIALYRIKKSIFRPLSRKKLCTTREKHLSYSCDAHKIKFFSLVEQYTIISQNIFLEIYKIQQNFEKDVFKISKLILHEGVNV